jgi:NitT/TauT family transport system permease protein
MEKGSKFSDSRFGAFGLPVIGAIAAVGLWWLATIVFHIREFMLPPPPAIVKSFLALPGYLLLAAGTTLRESVIGFGVATAGGLVLALLLSASRLVERAVMPLMVAANAIPKLAIAPLLIIWMGFGQTPKIVMVILVCFFPILISAMAGLTSTPSDLGELARSLSASRVKTFLKVRLPWALPQIFVGLKVAISLAVIGAVIAEFSGASQGLGFVIVNSGQQADTPLAFVAIVLLAVLSIGLFYILVGIERLLLPWVRETSG